MPSFGLVVGRRLQAGADLRHLADHKQGARANSDWDGARRGRCCGRAPERERFAHANPSDCPRRSSSNRRPAGRDGDASLVDNARASALESELRRYVLAARNLLRGDKERAHALEAAFDGVGAKLPVSEEKELHFLKAFPGRTGSGYVVDCFWSAWDAFAEGDSWSPSNCQAHARMKACGQNNDA